MMHRKPNSKTFMQLWMALAFLLLFVLSFLPSQAEDLIVIEYWQPNLGNASMKSRINGIDILIAEFESLHPDIDVVQNSSVLSASYEPSVGLALRDGQGPDVVTLFNGWIPSWI